MKKTIGSEFIRFPQGTWDLYHPDGRVIARGTTEQIVDYFVRQDQRGKWTPPEDTPVRWDEQGGLWVQTNDGKRHLFLRLVKKGGLELPPNLVQVVLDEDDAVVAAQKVNAALGGKPLTREEIEQEMNQPDQTTWNPDRWQA